jgi:hypothetical protein
MSALACSSYSFSSLSLYICCLPFRLHDSIHLNTEQSYCLHNERSFHNPTLTVLALSALFNSKIRLFACPGFSCRKVDPVAFVVGTSMTMGVLCMCSRKRITSAYVHVLRTMYYSLDFLHVLQCKLLNFRECGAEDCGTAVRRC